MNRMRCFSEICPLEICLKLKKAGFDYAVTEFWVNSPRTQWEHAFRQGDFNHEPEKVVAYDEFGQEYTCKEQRDERILCSAPTYGTVFDWLFEKDLKIEVRFGTCRWSACIDGFVFGHSKDSWKEAADLAIENALASCKN